MLTSEDKSIMGRSALPLDCQECGVICKKANHDQVFMTEINPMKDIEPMTDIDIETYIEMFIMCSIHQA